MAKQEVTSFRPRIAVIDDYMDLLAWCKREGISFSAIVNAYIPAISYAARHQLVRSDDGKWYIESDFGHVEVIGFGKYHTNTNWSFRRRIARPNGGYKTRLEFLWDQITPTYYKHVVKNSPPHVRDKFRKSRRWCYSV